MSHFTPILGKERTFSNRKYEAPLNNSYLLPSSKKLMMWSSEKLCRSQFGSTLAISPTLIKQEFSTMTNMQYIGSSAFTKRIRKIRLTGFKRQKVIFCPYYRGKNFLKTRTLDSWGLPLGHRSNKRKIMKTYSQHSHYSVAIFQLLQSIPVLQQSLSSLYTKIRLTLV